MSVLDPDGSGDVSMAEWEAYVASLKTVALKLVSGIKEPRSKTLLDKIVSFHYDTLWRCLEKHVATVRPLQRLYCRRLVLLLSSPLTSACVVCVLALTSIAATPSYGAK